MKCRHQQQQTAESEAYAVDALAGGAIARATPGGVAGIQRQGAAPATLTELDELLNKFDVPEAKVIELLGKLTGGDKQIVLGEMGGGNARRNKLANALSLNEMKMALDNLQAPLIKALDWLRMAAGGSALMLNWLDIKGFVFNAKQGERDAIKDTHKGFFLDVCKNENIVEAVTMLKYDLPTQISWCNGESNSLTLSQLTPLLQNRKPDELTIIAGDFYYPFWTKVAKPAEITNLVDLLFPRNLVGKLEWWSRIDKVPPEELRAKAVAEPDEDIRKSVATSGKLIVYFKDALDAEPYINFIFDLGGDWQYWKVWADAKTISYKGLMEAALKRNKITDPVTKEFVTNLLKPLPEPEMRNYLRKMPDASAKVLAAQQMTADLLLSEYGNFNGPSLAKEVNMEIAKAEVNPKFVELLSVADKTTNGIFVDRPFSLDARFTVSLRRDLVEVSVGVALAAAAGDARAASLLPGAKPEWLKRIMATWDGKFKLKNTDKEIPLKFNVSLDGGPNVVTAHSGKWVWPNLNAANWFVPDDRQPGQKEAVTQAPVHEFGHLIGNKDEYALSAKHFIEVTGRDPTKELKPKTKGGKARVLEEKDRKGNKRYTDNVSVMGAGGPVLAAHIKPIEDWVNANLRPEEPPFKVVPA